MPDETPATKSSQPTQPTPIKAAPSKSLPTAFPLFTSTAAVISASKRAIHHSKVVKRKLRKNADDLAGDDEEQIGGVEDDDDDAMPAMTKKKKKARDVTTKKVALTKSDFSKMEIVGQFNLGFILARDHRNQNLWILDQHGCDEIKNFERLIKDTKIHEQRLIAPLPLELSPSEEDTVIENLEIFEMNGFRFDYDETKPPRQRLALTALPHSGSGGDGRTAVQFGVDDVGALCSMLGADGASSVMGYGAGTGTGADGSGMGGMNHAVKRYAGGGGRSVGKGAIVRLPKAVAMFASRACRHSIMIGTALSEKQMGDVVVGMEKVEQPWNCPHGRPTMRHVSELGSVIEDDTDIFQDAHLPSGEEGFSQR
ncbi:hypothetical protein TrRE_jg9040 [Triparma retinervis]|uniref:MutL C-terminal dimerisation domain-containing protein n=1 Tax=Triparma retinervis TaxID=2557542 RepID=A0A9W7DL24_9STRA|nr:hypothetical protein TrRE_jg9040 [Triparma retinervis]